ncbi:MAG TPA: UDP-3-O-[3-hydroxymyristoyl] N-acetylglucosamine deacetylase [Candidatus Aminicenantes bacterium]|nr:UDP-3-O-[3-hydroxymyristoyl] N-acetylglucosamine deacetylase [Candidatus Aminicenantes bacterium]
MKKVLVVDDEKNIQVSLASILEDEGYHTFFASSGEEAVEKIANINPDAVLLDIWLPGIDGLETLDRILTLDPSQIVIMISGHGSITTAVRAVKIGAYDFLEKPLSLDKVIFVLKRGLEHKQVLEENIKLRSMLEKQSGKVEREPEDPGRKRESSGVLTFDYTDPDVSRPQRTVRESGIFYGIGLHSGQKTGMVIKPLPLGKGIRFENISEKGYVPARVEYLDSTNHATSVKKDRLEARTIEHLMAALHAFGITNLAIKINKEVPIGDGSASAFCDFIRSSGVVDQEGFIPEVVIDRPLVVGEESPEGRYIRVDPADRFEVHYTLIYPKPLGRIFHHFVLNSPESFEKEIAPARTYGFVHEMNELSQLGLAEGGRMNNFILIDKGEVINTKLRFPDELARHKILDIMGDFYLLGRPIRGRITAQRTGHADNARMVNLIREKFL